MLAPHIAAAVRHGIDARLLSEAYHLDRAALDTWLDNTPSTQYAAALRVHAHLLNARPALAARSAA